MQSLRRAWSPEPGPGARDLQRRQRRNDPRDHVALHLDVQLLLQLAHVGGEEAAAALVHELRAELFLGRCANSAGVTSSFSTTFTITVPRSVTIGSLTLPAGSAKATLSTSGLTPMPGSGALARRPAPCPGTGSPAPLRPPRSPSRPSAPRPPRRPAGGSVRSPWRGWRLRARGPSPRRGSARRGPSCSRP